MIEFLVVLGVEDYKIKWDTLEDRYHRLFFVVILVIMGVVCPNRHGNRFLVGWGEMLESMMIEATVYVRGPYLLAMLYL